MYGPPQAGEAVDESEAAAALKELDDIYYPQGPPSEMDTLI